MANYIEKLEDELVSLMGDTGRQTLQACLVRVGGAREGNVEFFRKVALVKDLTQAFSMLMPENRLAVFKGQVPILL